jgi:SsrA-binding protein
MQAIKNKEAYFSFEILDSYEAGLVLTGQEVKSVKDGGLNLKGAYVTIKYSPAPELFLIGAHISAYKKAGPLPNYEPTRPRKLLVSKAEIKTLLGKLEQRGLTIVPLKVYTKRTLIKLEFGLAKGKKKFEKKAAKKKQDTDREIRRKLQQW